MPAYAQDSTFFTRRGIVVVIIIALHIGVAWAIKSGLARKIVEVLAPPIEVVCAEVDAEVQMLASASTLGFGNGSVNVFLAWRQ